MAGFSPQNLWKMRGFYLAYTEGVQNLSQPVREEVLKDPYHFDFLALGPAVKEEVQSLGATFIELPLEAQEGQGGYAKEQSEEFLRKQRELIGEYIAKSDVVITTAAVPGRKAPLLVTGDMVRGMRPGSVIVDLAAETGGNVELTQAGKEVDVGGVTIIGTRNVPSTMPLTTSQLFARNVANLLLHLVKSGTISLDFEDEITKGACVTHGGEIVNERARQMVGAA